MAKAEFPRIISDELINIACGEYRLAGYTVLRGERQILILQDFEDSVCYIHKGGRWVTAHWVFRDTPKGWFPTGVRVHVEKRLRPSFEEWWVHLDSQCIHHRWITRFVDPMCSKKDSA